jgi:hypothetical protein
MVKALPRLQHGKERKAMTDQQVNDILSEGFPIAAVLLVRGGWLSSAESVEVRVAFPADAKGPALWKVLLADSHAVYIEASSIIGISVERHRDLHEERIMADQAQCESPRQGA